MKPALPWWVALSVFAILCLLSMQPHAARVISVDPVLEQGVLRISVVTQEKVKFRHFTMADPTRVVLYLPDTTLESVPDAGLFKHPPLKRLRHGIHNHSNLQLIFDLENPLDYRVESTFNVISNQHHLTVIFKSPEFAASPSPVQKTGSTKDESEQQSALSGALTLPEELASNNLPALPTGLNDSEEIASSAFADNQINGFWEMRLGSRIVDDPYQKQASIQEARFQLRMERSWDNLSLRFAGDLLYDGIPDEHTLDLDDGKGFLDIRELSLLTRPADFMDVKIGRQILTWGTGDLVFINDLFPKDWQSYFIGRDNEYLKAPSDAFKASFFSKNINMDLVYTPRFDADRFIDGSRISFFNGITGGRSGRDNPIETQTPQNTFSDDETAIRLYRNLAGYELAAYAYWGFWKSPSGIDPVITEARFPSLDVYGVSIRGALGKGIGHLEAGYYDSREDDEGDSPWIRNSELRFLMGYEQEVARETTLGIQYYLERMLDYDGYQYTLPEGTPVKDENRHVLTLRLTRLAQRQNLMLSLFAYYSPSDRDGYLRPKIHYRVDDNWSLEGGLNLFFGKEPYTFFGQFEKNSNLYFVIRYVF